MKKIMNIHGYKGSTENSACIALKNLGHEVISPQIDYDSENPEKILDDLRKVFLEYKPDFIVGTSLGGFFALLLSQEFKVEKYESHLKKYVSRNIPTVLINPCLKPSVTLSELGYTADKTTETTLSEYENMIEEMGCYNLSLSVCAIIGGQDEVISYHDYTKRIIKNNYVVPEGKHSGATLNLDYWLKRLIK